MSEFFNDDIENTLIPENNEISIKNQKLNTIISLFMDEEKEIIEDNIKTKIKEDFEEKRSQLEERISVIEQGLSRCDVKSIQLGTEEIVELFYKIFNPGDVESKINIK